MSTSLSPCGSSQTSLIESAANGSYYFVGDSVVIEGFGAHDGFPECNNVATAFVGYIPDNSPQEVSFELDIDGAEVGVDYDVCISDRSGRTTITPLAVMERDAPYNAALVARDRTGDDPIVIARWRMTVRTREDFAFSDNRTCAQAEMERLRAAVAPGNGAFGEHERYATVIVGGFNTSRCPLSELFVNYRRAGETPRITFKFNATELGGDPNGIASLGEDTFVNSDTGKLSLTLDNLGRYTVILQAESGDQSVDLINWTMHVREGPNGSTCGEHGGPADDSTIYSCVCTNDYSGLNCEVPPAPALADASSTSDTMVISYSLGGVLFFIAAVVIGGRIQMHRLKHRPLDMGLMQDEVLGSLGMKVPLDIADHEFGVELVFEAKLVANPSGRGDRAIAPESHLGHFREQLIESVAKCLPWLADGLQKKARIVFCDLGLPRVLLIIAFPSPNPGFAQHSIAAGGAAAAIAKEVRDRKLKVATNTVVSARLALPRRVPREIDRKTITRIERIGQGAFAEVHLHQVIEPGRGVPPYMVAAKTIRPEVHTVDRDDLLREAALMALLNHRNVLALVGVVTAPRDLPALVLLTYCEGGELSNVVKGPGLSVTKRLTYAAQIALGMQYISTRNIVHRDLAARNVLLDAMGVCKVADFGMSASLVRGGKTYASKYIRVHEEIALRWAAPEALQHERFSVSSDVWAYGITVWEIFACGAEPYSGLGLGEVGPFVKGGGRLCPPANVQCPAELFDELMQPCWAADPNGRTGFGELYDAAVRHGALEDAVALEMRAKKRNPHDTASQGSTAPVEQALLGPSTHHLADVLVPGTVAAIVEIQTVKGHEHQAGFDSLNDPNDADVWHMVHAFAKPRSANTICPRDQDRGCAYVDTLHGRDHVGGAIALLSYSWSYRILDVSEALQDWGQSSQRDPKGTYIWICSLCMNQHDFERRLLQCGATKGPGALQKAFGDRVVAIGRILPMLAPWNDPGYIKRAWCLFELYTAIRKPEQVQIDIILPPTQHTAFRHAINTQGYGVIDAPLELIDAASASASNPADLESIRRLVRGYAGGFDTLNETVRNHLKRWFETAGGIRVSSARATGTWRSSLVSATSSNAGSRSDAGATDTLRAMAVQPLGEMNSLDDVAVGDRVVVDGRAGVVRFVGAVRDPGSRHAGEIKAGVELDRPEGKHSGTVDGTPYFKCGEKCGVFVTAAQIEKLAPAWFGDASSQRDVPRQADSGDGQGDDLPSTLGFDDGAARVRNANTRDSARLTGFELPDAADDDGDGYFDVHRASMGFRSTVPTDVRQSGLSDLSGFSGETERPQDTVEFLGFETKGRELEF